MRRYVIVGTSIAALAAAEAIRRKDSSGEITLIGEEPRPFYFRPDLAYLLTGEIPESALFTPGEAALRRLGVQRITRRRATAVDLSSHQVEVSDGRQIPFDRLLLATGSLAVKPKIPGAHLNGVAKLDSLGDAHRLLRLTSWARSAVVVGGGIIALQLAEGLWTRGLEVHLLLRSERYWKNVLDKAESEMVEGRLKDQGIHVYTHAEPVEITGRGGQVTGVRLGDWRWIPCDLVALATGVRPRKELADGAGVLTDRGILVDETLQTNAPDVFAAGDVAEVYDATFGRSLSDTLWWAARSQGTAAGQNMAGDCTPYQKPVSFNSTRLMGVTTTLIGALGRGVDESLPGLGRGDSEAWRHLTNAFSTSADDGEDHLRVMVGPHTLLGAVLMGDQALASPLYNLIAEQARIDTIRERLFRPDRPLKEILAEFWRDWKQQHLVRSHVWTPTAVLQRREQMGGLE